MMTYQSDARKLARSAFTTHRAKRLLVQLLGLTALLLSSVSVLAAPGTGGQIAIFREATAGDVVANGGDSLTHDWDTTERTNATSYSLSGTNILCKAGHYLVLYSTRFDESAGLNSTSNRLEINTNLLVDSVVQPIGWSQGYARLQNGDAELICAGGGIINVAADDDPVALFSQRTDNSGAASATRVANASAIQLVKLDDTWDYCRLSRSTDQTGPTNTTFIDVTYNTQDELDTGSFGHTGGSGNITLKTAGHYLVYANTYFQFSQTLDSRSGYKQQLTLDGAVVNGTLTTVYMRGNANSNSCSDGAATVGTIIQTSTTNQILNVEVNKETGANPTILAGRTAITIVKLPDDGDYIRLDDSGNDVFNPSAGGLGWDTELERDATGFGHSDSQISAAVADDFLFFTRLYDNDDGGARVKWWQRWRVNGTTTKEWGQTGRYARNTGTQSSGNGSAIILAMAQNDYVEVISDQLGAGGVMEAREKGLEGVRIGSILSPTPIVNTAASSIADTTADLNGTLFGAGATYTVTAYWSTNNNADSTAWQGDGSAISQVIGTFNNASGQTMTASVTGLTANTTYYYTLAATNGGTTFATPNATFTTLTAESNPPLVSLLNPTNGQIDVALDGNLVATFDEAVFLTGSGSIVLQDVGTATPVATTLSTSGNDLIIDPTANLAPNTLYEILISNDAVDDIFDNNFAGLGANAWRFTSDKPPEVSTLSPTNNATDVQPDANLAVTFDENVSLVNGGVITLMNVTDTSSTTITLPDARVSVLGAVVTIDPSTAFELGDIYAVQFDNASVEDSAGNRFAGISDTSTWRFTVTLDPNWALVAYWPLDDGPVGPIAAGTVLDDVIDDPSSAETDATINNTNTSSFVFDALRNRNVWRTPDSNRADAGDTQMNRDFTWAVWIKAEAGDEGPVLGTRDGQYARLTPRSIAADGYGISFSFTNAGDYSDGAWHHLAFTRSGNTFSAYVDGSPEGSRTVVKGDNLMRFEMGGHSRFASDFNGFMSDAAVWAETLTLARIQDLAAGGPVQLDDTAPVVNSLNPPDNDTGVAPGSNLVITFDEDVSLVNGGTITIKNLTDVTQTVITLPDAQVTALGATVTINPSSDLTQGKEYAIQVSADAIKNGTNYPFAGIADDTSWSFNVGAPDTVPPTLQSTTPVHNATGVLVTSSLVATFDENVQLINGGTVTLKNLTDASQIDITLPDAQVTAAGPQVTITSTASLDFGDLYAIVIAAATVEDASGNDFAGIADTAWRFTTDVAPTVTTVSPADNATSVTPYIDLMITFDQNVQLVPGGVITLKNLTDATNQIIALLDPRVTVNNATITIAFDQYLERGATYAVQIDGSSIADLDGQNFPGITDDTTWNFTVTDDPNSTVVAYWPLNDGAHGDPVVTADDVIDDPNSAETDGAGQGTGGTWFNDPTRGIVFSTTEDDRIQVGRSEMNRNFTWSIWAKGTDSSVLMGTRSGTYTRLSLTAISGNYVSFDFPDFNDDAWHHLAFRREGNVFKVYVDGIERGTRTSAAGDNLMQLELGGSSSFSEDFTGLLSEAAVWAEALSETRIQDLAAGGPVLFETGTVIRIR